MDNQICKKFQDLLKNFPDELDNNKKYKFNDDKPFQKYCNSNCDADLGKINAGCLYLFNEIFEDSSLKNHNKISIVEYIMIWLSYMLSLKENELKDSLQHFYRTYINGSGHYNKSIIGVENYSSYKDLLNKKKYFEDMDNNIISNFYKAFKLLCELYTLFDKNNQDCKTFSEKANQFVKKYNELSGDHNNINVSSYKQVLCTLSTDYDNFINKCNDTHCCKSSTLPTIDKNKIPVNCPEQTIQISDAASSPSIAKKLIIVLSIFAAIPIFLGIAYKYSLFGFRKRAPKHLREKIKNIKKKMVH
ncbi:PIR protein [Plasmodium yoelii]|uniref:PIR protein n=2 Tax=Plasmodium yoelii TaxID=5861 RepID=A0AAE9WNM2_PLAYO|nr:PIR protein [Plasmodium yoelii]WBY57085.1 PIR protein [Plasmodium yoelii yoelii]CDU17785.1 YIR protein [Plasmodium yoelii]VTZ78202.1 PIR protein [Plasmodium yoelii]|eukprot:XP_022812092.1 PIR protein [Plasmodium yoelii]